MYLQANFRCLLISEQHLPNDEWRDGSVIYDASLYKWIHLDKQDFDYSQAHNRYS